MMIKKQSERKQVPQSIPPQLVKLAKYHSERVRVKDHKWWECPVLTTAPFLRHAPFFAPISWAQTAGLVGLIMEARNVLGEGNNFKLVELGTCNGESAAMFLGSGMFERAWLFDYWSNDTSEGLCEYNMRPYGDKAVMVYGDLNVTSKAWETPIDMIYIDAGHEYEDVKQNFKDWEKHVRKGGILSGHDYSKAWPGVMQAVDEFKREHGCEIKTFADSSWFLVKTW